VRDLHHVVDAVFPDARWIPLTRPGLDNTPITVYRWANRRDSEDIATIQNVDGVTYLGPTGVPIGDAAAGRRYRGLIVDVRGEGADGRWAFWAGWTSSRNEGTVDNTFDSSIGRSWLFASPSAALINTDGRATVTPTHKVSALATARIPWIGARVSAVYLGRTGHQYAAVRQFGNETLDFPQSEDGRQVLLEARGARRLDFDDTLDLRGEYAVALGGRRSITLYADVMNLMNRASVLEVSKLYPLSSAGGASIVRFEAPTRVREPRQLYIGGRFAF
jgi:hypothetical protein